MISVFTVAYNEELQIKFLIDHYRSRFPECHIIVYDNMSTDGTVKIAKENDCQILLYDTGEKINDSKYLEIKNNCWKQAKTDWVLICDVDELLDINQNQLKEEGYLGATVIKSEGYNMINMEDNLDIASITHGVRHAFSDKSYLFNKKYIQEINYEPGCHKSNPVGTVSLSKEAYKAYHYNFINADMSVEKYKTYAKRLSPENIQKGWGVHYTMPEEKIRAEFLELRKNAVKLF